MYLFFEISENNFVNIHIGKGYGEYLYNQKIENWEDVFKLRSTLNDLFYNSVKEKLVYCNDKLIRCEYTVLYEEHGVVKPYEFSSYFGTCWFWQIKQEKENRYSAWIEK